MNNFNYWDYYYQQYYQPQNISLPQKRQNQEYTPIQWYPQDQNYCYYQNQNIQFKNFQTRPNQQVRFKYSDDQNSKKLRQQNYNLIHGKFQQYGSTTSSQLQFQHQQQQQQIQQQQEVQINEIKINNQLPHHLNYDFKTNKENVLLEKTKMKFFFGRYYQQLKKKFNFSNPELKQLKSHFHSFDHFRRVYLSLILAKKQQEKMTEEQNKVTQNFENNNTLPQKDSINQLVIQNETQSLQQAPQQYEKSSDEDEEQVKKDIDEYKEQMKDPNFVPIKLKYPKQLHLDSNLWLDINRPFEERFDTICKEIGKQVLMHNLKLFVQQTQKNDQKEMLKEAQNNLNLNFKHNQQQKTSKGSNLSKMKAEVWIGPTLRTEKCVIIVTSWGIIKQTTESIQIQVDIADLRFWLELDHCLYYLKLNNLEIDVIVMDPPWDQTALNLSYDVMKNETWMTCINLKKLQRKGLLFIWITNFQLEQTINYMERNGYRRVEVIAWIKINEDFNLQDGIGYYLRHMMELCIVGIKQGENDNIKDLLKTHTGSNVIISNKREQSRKPDQLYELIETICPNKTYLEIFGRKFNRRRGWITVGNEAIFFKSNEEREKYKHFQ